MWVCTLVSFGYTNSIVVVVIISIALFQEEGGEEHWFSPLFTGVVVEIKHGIQVNLFFWVRFFLLSLWFVVEVLVLLVDYHPNVIVRTVVVVSGYEGSTTRTKVGFAVGM